MATFKSMECLTKIKIDVGKCIGIGGEVGGFKHLDVETKQPNRVSGTSPCHKKIAEYKIGAGNVF